MKMRISQQGTANGKICVMRTGGCNGFVLSAQIAHEICLPICLLYTTIFTVEEENCIFFGLNHRCAHYGIMTGHNTEQGRLLAIIYARIKNV